MATESSAGRAQRILFFLLTLASVLLLSGLTQSAPAMAQTVDRCAATGMELLNTDKWGYESGETVHFTGTGYAPGCTYTVTVIEPTNQRINHDLVTTDAAGNVSYDYPIVNGVQEVYVARITGIDGNDLSGVMFSDAAPCDVTVPSMGFPTIQSAVTALPNANPGTACVITVLAGTYAGGISWDQKNSGGTDTNRYIIRADPSAALGDVVVTVSGSGEGFTSNRSHFITIQGFEIRGLTNGVGNSGIALAGGSNSNNDITIEGNYIHDIGGPGSAGASGIGVAVSNSNVWIVNNLIRNNGRDGVSVDRSSTFVVNNTIVENKYNGVSRNVSTVMSLVNNLIVGNGTAGPGGSGNCQAGLCQVGVGTAADLTLVNNMFYKNGTGNTVASGVQNVFDIANPAATLDASDTGNYTTTGHANNLASTPTGIAGCTFASCDATHAFTEIFASAGTTPADYKLKTGSPISPAIDKGVISYVSGGFGWVPVDDFEGTARPQNGGVSLKVDIGYNEVPTPIVNYTLTYTAGANGTLTGSTAQTVSSGGNGTPVTAVPKAGYHFLNWSDATTSNPRTDINVTANISVTANFAIDNYNIVASSGANGSVTPAGSTTVDSGGSQAYTITAVSGYHIADVLVDGVSQGAVGSYTFTNVTVAHTISATFAVNTYNIVASSGANGSVTPAGSTTVDSGGSQAYTITAVSGYHIADVLVDGVSQGAVGSYTFTNVTAAHTISATFAVNTYSIVASSGANGSVTPAGSTTVDSGGSQAYTITADSGYHIADVLVDGVSQGAVGSYTFTNVTVAHTISATFAVNTYSIVASSGANGSVTPAGSTTVDSGGSQAYTVTADSGYHIADVLVDGVSQGAIGSYTFTNVTANHTIAATFAVNTYNIVASSGANGSVTPAGSTTVDSGASQAYTVTADSGYHIADVLVDGVSQGAIGSYTFTNVTANHTIAATFAVNTYNIVASSGANGSVTPAGSTTVDSGASQAYTVTADSGYHIADVLVDGVSQGAIGLYTFTNVTANHTIAATFAVNTYNIVASSGANGSVTPAGTTTVDSGASQAYTISADSGYHIVDVLVDGVSQGAIGSYTFTNVTAVHTISASFTPVLATDTTPPVTSNTSADPWSVQFNTSMSITVTATVTDAASAIYSAEVQLDGGDWMPMTFVSGTSKMWNVTANVTPLAPWTSGVHTICVRGTDVAFQTATTGNGIDCILVAAYDPSAGFVTGGGWINSPAGAYTANPSLTGKANFGFVSKYQNGKSVPTGDTEFNFKAGDFNFKSTSYDYLVISGGKATYQGNGSINGVGDFKFILTVIDGDVGGTKKDDTFRLKVYADNQGNGVKYDNNAGALTDDTASTTTIGGGSIVIHNK